MSLSNYKLTDDAIAQKGVVAAPDKMTGTAAQNKAVFDRLIREAVQELFNGLIDVLASSDGAAEIGTTAISGVTGADVQTVLGSLKTLLDTKSASADVTASLALKSDKAVTDLHLKSVSFNAQTGVFTFTREDGSYVAIDTALEKVATNWQYDAAAQSLVLTLADGTTQSVPLSAFITETEFTDSAQLAFSVSDHTVTATVKSGSITDAMLSSALVAQLQGHVTSAADSAADALQCKNAAEGFKNAVDSSAAAAALSATSAAGSATTASTKAGEASASATAAASSASAADGSAEDSEAWAVGKRDGTDVPGADPTYHNNAKYWAEQASGAAGGGVASFNGRSGFVSPQSGDYTPDMVGALADRPIDAAPTADSSNLVTSGGVKIAIDATVTSFNGRTGAVTPQSGDYTAAMVGAASALQNDVTYYIDSDAGLDTNDGTVDHPFKTVQHAIDLLPKNLNGHRVNILLEPDGKTYDSSVSITGFYGGFYPIGRGNGGASIVIDSNYSSQTPVTASPIFGAINVTNCAISVSLWGLKVTNGITVEGCLEFNTGFTSEGNSAYGLYIRCCPYAKVDGWKISNKTTAAIIVADSNVFLMGWGVQGSNNAVGLKVANNQAQSGFVNAAYSLPQGTTTLQKTNAAVVFLNGVLQT